MKRLFGTDGIRGLAGQFPLDAPTIKALGASLVNHLRAKSFARAPVIVIGRDTRESGAWLEQAFISGATAAGAECKSAGVITTPGVAFLARTLPAEAGVVISASHNPYYDNGVKIFSPSGKKLEDSTERLIEADLLKAADQHEPTEDAASASLETTDPKGGEARRLRARYLNFLADEVAMGLMLKDVSMVIDCANGAASSLAPELFRRLGAKVFAINNQPNGRNINDNCGSMHIEELQRTVLKEHADLGVAFDGDADRALFVDANRTFVDGDATMWVLANYLNARGELRDGVVVATVMSNIGLEIALHSRGLRLLRTDVGDKYVLEELLRTEASLGGEQSGHLIFPKLSLAGDGMITALYLLRAMSEGRSKLHELTEGFSRYPQVLVNVGVREKKGFDEIKSVGEAVGEIEERLGSEGRLLLRYSGTESLARVMIEGKSQTEIEAYAARIANAIKDAIGES